MTELNSFMIFKDPQTPQYGSGENRLHGQPLSDDASIDYFRARERAERAAAKRAESEAARRVHQQLAIEYANRARQRP